MLKILDSTKDSLTLWVKLCRELIDVSLDGYSWLEYDPREGGVQVIKDGLNNVKLTTEFLKVPGGKHGGSWAARIKGKPIDPGTWVIGILNCNVRSVTRDTSPSFAFISHFLHWPGGSWWDRHGD